MEIHGLFEPSDAGLVKIWNIKILLHPPPTNDLIAAHRVMATSIGLHATVYCEPRQVRKEATVAVKLGALIGLVLVATLIPKALGI